MRCVRQIESVLGLGGRVRVEVPPEGYGEDVTPDERRERDESPVLREVRCTSKCISG